MGTPRQAQNLVIDTGSDISWVQCQPCDDKCYQQFDPIFDPRASTSFTNISCDNNSLICDRVDESNRGCDHSRRCTYKINYGDGTETQGTMALENITFGDTIVPNVPIGCGHKTDGHFTTTLADGVLSLAGGSLSFVSQSGGIIGGVFSYCLGNSGGWLGFGYQNVPTHANWASLIHNPMHPSFYYIDLIGPYGEGGVILDTGTTVTRLAKDTYEALRDKVKGWMRNYVFVGEFEIFDTCYNLQEVDLNQLPRVSFTFSTGKFNSSGITIEARYPNVMYQVDVVSCTYCLAFAPTSGLNIIGNFQQQGIQITVNTAGGYIGFGPGYC
ncbi:hypothetical protein CASFOL_005644 [Castilleja foliolosa]|uniref:Peptidase A1 domain-containing protein n=1 Tax=Castilleja foliolosa TaxID=1961234 RepID=A0ABD3E834_9LAMI